VHIFSVGLCPSTGPAGPADDDLQYRGPSEIQRKIQVTAPTSPIQTPGHALVHRRNAHASTCPAQTQRSCHVCTTQYFNRILTWFFGFIRSAADQHSETFRKGPAVGPNPAHRQVCITFYALDSLISTRVSCYVAYCPRAMTAHQSV
jgi:hypothetical protein